MRMLISLSSRALGSGRAALTVDLIGTTEDLGHALMPFHFTPPTHTQPDFTEEECRNFVTKAVSHAMARDGSSGGCIRTVTITKDGVKRQFIPHNQIPPYHGELKQPPPNSPLPVAS